MPVYGNRVQYRDDGGGQYEQVVAVEHVMGTDIVIHFMHTLGDGDTNIAEATITLKDNSAVPLTLFEITKTGAAAQWDFTDADDSTVTIKAADCDPQSAYMPTGTYRCTLTLKHTSGTITPFVDTDRYHLKANSADGVENGYYPPPVDGPALEARVDATEADNALDETHRIGDGSDHADVAANTIAISAEATSRANGDANLQAQIDLGLTPPEGSEVTNSRVTPDAFTATTLRERLDWLATPNVHYGAEAGISAAKTGAQNMAAWLAFAAVIGTSPSVVVMPGGVLTFDCGTLASGNNLRIPANTFIHMPQTDIVLTHAGGGSDSYGFVMLEDNVVFYGGSIRGDNSGGVSTRCDFLTRWQADGGMLQDVDLSYAGKSNCSIYGATSIRAVNTTFKYADQNNMSIVELAGGTFVDCDFESAGTTDPATVDLEPNSTSEVVEDVDFIRCKSTNNTLSGGYANGFYVQGKTNYNIRRIRFIDCESTGHTGIGLVANYVDELQIIRGRYNDNGTTTNHPGIYCYAPKRLTIDNSQTFRNTGEGIKIFSAEIAYVKVNSEANGTMGFFITKGTMFNRALTVTGRSEVNTQRGGRIKHGGDVTIRDLIIADNGTDGLLCDELFGFNVHNLKANGNGASSEYGLELADCENGDISHCLFTKWQTWTRGAIQSASGTSIVLQSGEATDDDRYNNWYLEMTSGAASGERRLISDYTGSTVTATIASAFSTDPSTSDTYVIVRGNSGAKGINAGGTNSNVQWSNCDTSLAAGNVTTGLSDGGGNRT